ncbi:DNA-(apurinic or apyrimidinic site) lyase 2 [Physocladia obscura]|uniref:DNA-(Apurinic or apyrimidinic site) lyase 2 n=1 Tax=Physocladia obscura TaxID=109957 RepID=A0AAD5TA59_9FUNG|nr:DNA-(apurinic or apyrimidinic site) lyase 2 [Physocladia obscura]
MNIASWNVNVKTSIFKPTARLTFPPRLGFMALKKLNSAKLGKQNVPPESVLRCSIPAFPDTNDIDIYCLQEFKCTREKIVREDLASIKGFYAFHSCSKSKTGYSGVSTITASAINPISNAQPYPICAQEGFLGRNGCPDLDFSALIPEMQVAIEAILSHSDQEQALSFSIKELRDFDEEGRAYFPNASEDEPIRYAFKTRFQQAIHAILKSLTQISQRNIILVGDLNICHKPIDHCDPNNHIRENKLDAFGDTVGRRWMDSIVSNSEIYTTKQFANKLATRAAATVNMASFSLVDVFRHFHPLRERAFTCWNTKIGARTANFGTRIDYILASPALLPWFEACDIRPDVDGSDHCPVVARLGAVNSETGELLRDVIGDGCNESNRGFQTAPQGCAELWDEVKGGGKQTNLKGWFVDPAETNKRKANDSGSDDIESRKKLNTTNSQTRILPADTHTLPIIPAKAPVQKSVLKTQPSVATFFKRNNLSEASPSAKIENDVSSFFTSSLESTRNFGMAFGLLDTDGSKEKRVSAWKSLMKRPENPKCYHNEEAKEFQV